MLNLQELIFKPKKYFSEYEAPKNWLTDSIAFIGVIVVIHTLIFLLFYSNAIIAEEVKSELLSRLGPLLFIRHSMLAITVWMSVSIFIYQISNINETGGAFSRIASMVSRAFIVLPITDVIWWLFNAYGYVYFIALFWFLYLAVIIRQKA